MAIQVSESHVLDENGAITLHNLGRKVGSYYQRLYTEIFFMDNPHNFNVCFVKRTNKNRVVMGVKKDITYRNYVRENGGYPVIDLNH